MPTPESVNNFYVNYGVHLDDASIKTAVSSILVNNSDPQVRDNLLKEYIKSSFQSFIIPFERQRQLRSLVDHGYTQPMLSVDMLDSYIGVVSQIAQIASGEQIESMQKAQEDAKKEAQDAVKIANAAADAANKAIANKEYGAKQKSEDANALVEKAKLRLARANDPANFAFNAWEPGLPKFGLTSSEVRKMYKDRVDSINNIKFADLRRAEMEDPGNTKVFKQVLNDLTSYVGDKDYNTVADDTKEALRNVYVTRQLMNERLRSKNWLWKLIFRSQTKEMEDYVNSADRLLSHAKFPEDLKESAMSAATTSGIRAGHSDLENASNAIDQTFAEADKAVEARNQEKLKQQQEQAQRKEEQRRLKEEKQKLDEKLQKEAADKAKSEKEQKEATRKAREEQAKKAIVGHEAEINAEAEALARMKKELPDAFFDIRFRPSWDAVVSKQQSDLAVQIGKEFFTGKKPLPAGVEAVFKANYAKIRAVREFVKTDLNTLEPKALQEKIKELDTQFAVSEEMVKIEHEQAGIKYEPVTKAQLELHQQLANEFKPDVSNANNVGPVEMKAPNLDKNQPNP